MAYIDFGEGPVLAHQHINPDGSLGGWVADTAHVSPTSFVGPNAKVFNRAAIHDEVRIFDKARVFGNALVSHNALISGDARVYGNARVYDNAWIYNRAEVYGEAGVFGSARVCGEAVIRRYARAHGFVLVRDTSWAWGIERTPALEEQRELAKGILKQVLNHADPLKMTSCHSKCQTSLGIAGWAQTLRGKDLPVRREGHEAAYECGIRLVPEMAPYFFDLPEITLKKLQELAQD